MLVVISARRNKLRKVQGEVSPGASNSLLIWKDAWYLCTLFVSVFSWPHHSKHLNMHVGAEVLVEASRARFASESKRANCKDPTKPTYTCIYPFCMYMDIHLHRDRNWPISCNNQFCSFGSPEGH